MEEVKNTYWGNTEVDINDLLGSVIRMAIYDVCGAIFIGVLLKVLCQIHVYEELCKIMEKYWISMSISMGSSMFYVCTNIFNAETEIDLS